jgi:aminopeptidase N
VDTIRSPLGGPLAIEDAGHHGNIVRTGFNDPDELIDGVTYVKSAEVIRMLRTIVGKDNFIRGKDLYFSRYMGGNANTDQFFACFEEVSGRNLSQFKKEWLHTIGYPQVSAKWRYSRQSRSLRITLRQKRTGKGRLHHLPIELAAVDSHGKDIPGTAQTVELTGKSHSLLFNGIDEPAFVSLNRNCSFYGSFHDESATIDHLLKQVLLDPDIFNRVEAMRKITDLQRVALLNDPDASIDPRWLEIYRTIVEDHSLPAGLKAYLLRIDELSMDRQYLPWYVERSLARQTLMKAAASHCRSGLVSVFNSTDTYRQTENPADGIQARLLRNAALRILSELDDAETHAMAEAHLKRAWNITDKIAALSCIQTTSHPKRIALLEETFNAWKTHLNGYSSYLGIVASGTHDDVFDQIAREEARPCFNINHPNHGRALYLTMTGNNRVLWTEKGQAWLADTVAKMAAVNDFTASRMIACLQMAGKMRDNIRPRAVRTLETIEQKLAGIKAPMTASRAAAFLKAARQVQGAGSQ